MKRTLLVDKNENNKCVKIQRTLTSMFGLAGPEFTEVRGVQLICPYCHRKFRAPQGLVSHK